MNIAEILLLKYTEEMTSGDIILQDDGEGVYIKTWPESLGKKPTQKQLDAWAIELAPVKKKLDARQARREEYPAMGDQLDAILKQFEAMKEDGAALVTEFDGVLKAWRAVKIKHPLGDK